ncbi:nicotinate (nicotinamide) nucleotide adenylyltransferase [Winogradskyella aurantiaca]|uniref:nicotinate (nicotinamide) nucleotide adenylyltransferase n=1 Tax=Winogradskyella aurantiaca TaxID=2219558 RepID=UPI000E1E0358|nr:nicotinate (nicotinamide) nucleotide adenylyltransferase [Winogradskyella aurantiaca]
MNIGLFFGTFNPIHVGHLIIANHMVEHSQLDEVWLVVTPLSPFKKKNSLLDNHQRLEMVYRATEDFPKLRPSDIEFNLPQPNYTIKTLLYLKEKFPEHDFSLIMGEDNLASFHKWKNYEEILNQHHIFVYPRIKSKPVKEEFLNNKKIFNISAPILELSSTFIRQEIKANRNIKPMLPVKVWEYLDEMNFYR